MKSYKQYFSLLLGVFISLLPASSALASFSGILPVASLGTTPTPAVVTMSRSTLGVGQTATVTFTFPAPPSAFTTGDISAPHGTISNLAVTGDPKVYTATFTPTAGVAFGVNTISVSAKTTMTTYTGVGSGTYDVAFDGTNIWATNGYDSSLTKITQTGTMTNYPGLASQPFSIAFDGTNMWTGNNAGGSVNKVTPTGTVSTFGSIGANIFGIAFDGTNMWTANYGADSVSKVAPGGSKTTYTGTGSGPWGIAFDGTNMWTANFNDSTVTKISPVGVMTTYSAGGNPIGIAFDGTNMWLANSGDGTVSKVGPAGATIAYATGGINLHHLAFDGTNMWVTDYSNNAVIKVTPSGVATTYTGTGANPNGIAFDGTNLWTANLGDGSVTKVGFAGAGTSANYAINTQAPLNVATTTTHSAGMLPIVAPQAMNGALDFSIEKNSGHENVLTLHFNADPSTVAGYAVSLDPTFTGTGIQPFATTGTLALPSASGTYTVYVEFFSTTGAHSAPVVHTISFNGVTATANTKNIFARTLTRGAQGSDVAALQKILEKDGELTLPSGAAYGYFGSSTLEALKAFQEKYGIVATGAPGSGMFGPKTEAKASMISSGQ